MQELQNTGVDGINDIKIELDDFMAKPAEVFQLSQVLLSFSIKTEMPYRVRVRCMASLCVLLESVVKAISMNICLFKKNA